jgi:hypothetical protein
MNSTTVELAKARARAQRLASRIGLDPNPWQNAANELKAEMEAEKQREAAEMERREANDTELFRRALGVHREAQRLFLNARRSEADVRAKIEQHGPKGHALLEPYRRWLGSQHGSLWKQYHDPELPPKNVVNAG